MEYLKVASKVIDKYGIEVFETPFVFRSLLSDLIGQSKIDNDLLNAFYLINQDKSLYIEIKNLSLKDMKAYVLDLISKLDKRYTKWQYIKSIEPMLFVLYPNEYVPIPDKAVISNSQNNRVVKNKVVINKPQQPVANKQPQVPVKANKPKKANVRKPFNAKQDINHIVIESTCESLEIKYETADNIHIFDSNGVEVTKTAKIWHKDDFMKINVPNIERKYIVQLPKKKYFSLRVEYNGSFLKIYGDKKTYFKATKAEINSNNSVTSLDIDTNTFVINQNSGDIFAIGKILNTYADLNSANITCYYLGNHGNYYSIESNSGDIDLEFVNEKVTPKVNHFLKRVRNVQGTYKLGKTDIRFDLVTNSGKIKVR